MERKLYAGEDHRPWWSAEPFDGHGHELDAHKWPEICYFYFFIVIVNCYYVPVCVRVSTNARPVSNGVILWPIQNDLTFMRLILLLKQIVQLNKMYCHTQHNCFECFVLPTPTLNSSVLSRSFIKSFHAGESASRIRCGGETRRAVDRWPLPAAIHNGKKEHIFWSWLDSFVQRIRAQNGAHKSRFVVFV